MQSFLCRLSFAIPFVLLLGSYHIFMLSVIFRDCLQQLPAIFHVAFDNVNSDRLQKPKQTLCSLPSYSVRWTIGHCCQEPGKKMIRCQALQFPSLNFD